MLSAYQYDIQFRSIDEHSNADGFSRLPMPVPEPVQDVAPASVFNMTQIACLPVDADYLQKATREDPLLSQVLTYTQNGWASTVDPELKPYSTKHTELTVEAGCLLWGIRVVVPKACQSSVLEELHVSHPGIVTRDSSVHPCVVVWD